MNDLYALAKDGKTPVKVDDRMEWARRTEDRERLRVDLDELPHGICVSTVFLAVDHNCGDGPPILWETMIFGGEHDDYQQRYSTYDDAVVGHARAVRMAKGEEAISATVSSHGSTD